MLESSNTSTPWTYSIFEKSVFQAPWFRREGQLLAVDGDQWIGMAAVGLVPETHSAYNEYTGVLRPYRRRKIATSLKVLAARYARQNGAQKLLTDSNMRNAPILAINRKMGYKRQPGKYTLVCEFVEMLGSVEKAPAMTFRCHSRSSGYSKLMLFELSLF